jgi:hypothetical protein
MNNLRSVSDKDRGLSVAAALTVERLAWAPALA